jgi:hypothetical protein
MSDLLSKFKVNSQTRLHYCQPEYMKRVSGLPGDWAVRHVHLKTSLTNENRFLARSSTEFEALFLPAFLHV